MAQRLSEYFVLEAGEFLDQLDRLFAASDAPDAGRFFRLARGIRGSAQIAEVGRVAEVAAQLESAARGLAEGRVRWSEELHASAVGTVEDLRVLVRAASAWGAAEETRARAAVERWSGAVAAGAADATPAEEGTRLLPFVHVELIGVRGELDRALLEMETAPGHAEPLRAVLRRMRAVRGIQGYDVLGPTLQMLGALDEAVRGVIAAAPAVGAAQMALLGTARALLSECIDALARGEAPSGDALAWVEFQQLASGAAAAPVAAEPGTVSIRELFHDDAGPHIIYSPVAPVESAAEGGEPSTAIADFLELETTGLLDRAEAMLAEAERGGTQAALGAELAELAAALRELAGSYNADALTAAADAAAREFAAARTPAAARAVLSVLRACLAGEESPLPVVGAEEVVPIESLLLRGDAAVRAALALRAEVEARLAEAGSAAEALREPIDELFALMQLALEPAPAD